MGYARTLLIEGMSINGTIRLHEGLTHAALKYLRACLEKLATLKACRGYRYNLGLSFCA